jgi:hypothetical protein
LVDAPESRYKGKRHAAKVKRMKADYLTEPRTRRERWKQRRAERWLVYDSIGSRATSLADTREYVDAMRERWRRWRAAQLGR